MTAFPTGLLDLTAVAAATRFLADNGTINGLGSGQQIADFTATLTQTLTNKTLTSPILTTPRTSSSTVALLPAAATSGAGARSFATDSLLPAWGAAVTGGGGVPIPVYSDGTVWRVG